MKKKIKFLLFIALAVLAVYGRAVNFKFVNLDEDQLLKDNWQALTSVDIKRAFQADVFNASDGVFYRPMLTLSFMPDAVISGAQPNPRVFYISNLLLHMLNAWLCFLALSALGAGGLAGLLGALIFALHPAMAGAVAWIPGRNDSLLFFFSALSGLALYSVLKNGGLPALAAHLLAFMAALLTKETAAALPVVFAAGALFLGGRGVVARARSRWQILAGWLLCAALYFFLRHQALAGSAGRGVAFEPWEIIVKTAVYAYYSLWPLDMPVYAYFADIKAWPALAANIIFLGFTAWLWRLGRRRALLYALCFYMFLAPGAFSYRLMMHRSYAAIFFFCAWLCEAFDAASGLRRNAGVWLAAALASAAAVLSFQFSGWFNGPVNFWTDAYARSPACSEAAYELGYVAQLDGNTTEAEKYYLASLGRNPAQLNARNNLAVIYKNAGKFNEALRLYQEELAVNPDKAFILENIGGLFMAAGDLASAVKYYDMALAADPGRSKAAEKRAFCLLKLGRR